MRGAAQARLSTLSDGWQGDMVAESPVRRQRGHLGVAAPLFKKISP